MRGSIVKKGKKYYIVLDLDREPGEKRNQKWISGFDRRKDAEDALPGVMIEYQNGFLQASDPKITVKKYLTDWIDAHEDKLAKSTAKSYRETINNYLIPNIGSIKLRNLAPASIQKLYKHLLKDLSPTTVLYVHRILKGALKQAVFLKLIPYNPADAVKPPRKADPKDNTLKIDDVPKILEALTEPLYTCVLIALTTGLRRGEICALTWDMVDTKSARIYVSESVRDIKGELVITKTKTGKGRTVVIMNELVRHLEKIQRQQKEDRLFFGAEYKNDSNYVVRWEDGRRVKPDYISSAFHNAMIKLGFPDVRFHDLRHTHATMLLVSGTNPKIVQERLGHASITTTLNTYSHVIPDMQSESVSKLEHDLFKKIK